jgi:hypothetical protein
MSELTKGREFQLWEYRVSHGSLLIRSPAGPPEFETNIDIICVGVEYLAAPRQLGEIIISEATEVEIEKLEDILDKKLPSSRVWVLQGGRHRSLLVAAALRVQEYRGNIFDSPFSR